MGLGRGHRLVRRTTCEEGGLCACCRRLENRKGEGSWSEVHFGQKVPVAVRAHRGGGCQMDKPRSTNKLRKKLELYSTKAKPVSRTGETGYNTSVAKGPDGTRGFSYKRTRLLRRATPVTELSLDVVEVPPLAGGGNSTAGSDDASLPPKTPEWRKGAQTSKISSVPAKDVWDDSDDDDSPSVAQGEAADNWEEACDSPNNEDASAASKSGFDDPESVYGKESAANAHMLRFEQASKTFTSSSWTREENEAQRITQTMQQLGSRSRVDEKLLNRALIEAIHLPTAELKAEFHGRALRAACPLVVRVASVDDLDQRVVTGLAAAMREWWVIGATDVIAATFEGAPVFTLHLRLLIKIMQSLLRGPGRQTALRRHVLVPSVLDILMQMPVAVITGMRLVRSLLEDLVGICHAGVYTQAIDQQLPADLTDGLHTQAQVEQEQAPSDSESESESDGEEEEIKRFAQSQGSYTDLLPKRDLVVEQAALKPEDRLLLWYLSSLAEADCQHFFKRSSERAQLRDLVKEAGITIEVAVLEADSLLLRLLSEYGVDFDASTSGQMLHFIHVLEKLLQDFVTRGCQVQVVFFEVHKALWGDQWRFLLARRVMYGHIQWLHSEGKLPLPALQFEAWHVAQASTAASSQWNRYILETRPSLIFLDRRWLALRLLHMQCARQQISIASLNTIRVFSPGAELPALIYAKEGTRDAGRTMESFAGDRYMDVLVSWRSAPTKILDVKGERLGLLRNFELRRGGTMRLVIGACAETLRGADESDIAEISFLSQLYVVSSVLQTSMPLEWRAQSVRNLDPVVMHSVSQFLRTWCASAVNLCGLLDDMDEATDAAAMFPPQSSDQAREETAACQSVNLCLADAIDGRLYSCIVNFVAVTMCTQRQVSLESALRLTKEQLATAKALWTEVVNWAGSENAKPWNAATLPSRWRGSLLEHPSSILGASADDARDAYEPDAFLPVRNELINECLSLGDVSSTAANLPELRQSDPAVRKRMQLAQGFYTKHKWQSEPPRDATVDVAGNAPAATANDLATLARLGLESSPAVQPPVPNHTELLAYVQSCVQEFSHSSSAFVLFCKKVMEKHSAQASSKLLRLLADFLAKAKISDSERQSCKSMVLLVVQAVFKQLGNTVSGADALSAVKVLCKMNLLGPAAQFAADWIGMGSAGPEKAKFASQALGMLSNNIVQAGGVAPAGATAEKSISQVARQYAGDAISFQLEHIGEALPWTRMLVPVDLTAGYQLPGGMKQLEAWQWAIIKAAEFQESMLVVAPTSAGKTCTMQYIVQSNYASGDDNGVVVLVLPTEALAKQAFRSMASDQAIAKHHSIDLYSAGKKFNPSARTLITVPDCLEKLLLSRELICQGWHERVQYVIFDEVHCTTGTEGGVSATWEHLLLLVNCPFVALSADIGNAGTFVAWLRKINSSRSVQLIVHRERALGLNFQAYSSVKPVANKGKAEAQDESDSEDEMDAPKLERLARDLDVRTVPIHPCALLSLEDTDELFARQITQLPALAPPQVLELYSQLQTHLSGKEPSAVEDASGAGRRPGLRSIGLLRLRTQFLGQDSVEQFCLLVEAEERTLDMSGVLNEEGDSPAIQLVCRLKTGVLRICPVQQRLIADALCAKLLAMAGVSWDAPRSYEPTPQQKAEMQPRVKKVLVELISQLKKVVHIAKERGNVMPSPESLAEHLLTRVEPKSFRPFQSNAAALCRNDVVGYDMLLRYVVQLLSVHGSPLRKKVHSALRGCGQASATLRKCEMSWGGQENVAREKFMLRNVLPLVTTMRKKGMFPAICFRFSISSITRMAQSLVNAKFDCWKFETTGESDALRQRSQTAVESVCSALPQTARPGSQLLVLPWMLVGLRFGIAVHHENCHPAYLQVSANPAFIALFPGSSRASIRLSHSWFVCSLTFGRVRS
eukprot:COSAG05_NODE_65_length_22456_cov_17.448540_7_plen_1914_part_00